MGAILNQYTEKQVAFWIDGYFTLSPGSTEGNTVHRAFECAKHTVIEAMMRHVAEIRAMPLERWQQLTECQAGRVS
jgi:hypothetical protein